MSKKVKDFYNQSPRREWKRLFRDPYHQIEYEVTWHFISKYLPKKASVIDIGGGPGRYSIRLLKSGRKATLVDISEGLLGIGQRELTKQKLVPNGIYCRSAIDLYGIPENSYDSAILLGPLYHLTKEKDRIAAVKEALRVIRPGGYIFSAIINRFSPIKDWLVWLNTDPEKHKQIHNKKALDELRRMIKTGCYDGNSGFTEAYFANVDEIPKIYSKLGIKLVESFSCEGIASFFRGTMNGFLKDKKTWDKMLPLIIETSTHPDILGSGEHTVFVGRKTRPQ